jgi:hypothetical protein
LNTHHMLIQSITGGNDEVVLQFFVAFSRFEYALKRSGFVKCGPSHSVLPDWNKFASERLDEQIEDLMDTEFTAARSYLFQKPPQRQILRSNNTTGWCENSKRHNESEGVYLLRLVRDVRNNLFHGGKYPRPDGLVTDQALHNSQLLQACLTILEKCLSLDAKVKGYFEEHV